MTAHALFIGNNLYSDRNVPPLHCAQRDASELYHLFKRDLGYGAHAHLLEAPRQEEVYEMLDAIGQQVRSGDSFLLYFAGHGVESADGHDQYLLLGGARMLLLQSAQGTPAGTLSVRDLVTVTNVWPKVQRVMVFDACRTRLVPTMGVGAGLQGLPVFGSEKVLQQIATRDMQMSRDPAATAGRPPPADQALPPVFIKSCQSDQLAVELVARQRSMFGLAFDDVLQQARGAGEAVLTNAGLLAAIAQRMAQLAMEHGVGAGQQPWMSDRAAEARLYVPEVRPSPPEPSLATARKLAETSTQRDAGVVESIPSAAPASEMSKVAHIHTRSATVGPSTKPSSNRFPWGKFSALGILLCIGVGAYWLFERLDPQFKVIEVITEKSTKSESSDVFYHLVVYSKRHGFRTIMATSQNRLPKVGENIDVAQP